MTTVIIKNLTDGDIYDFCMLEETSGNIYTDVENKSVEITNPTDYQLQIIPDFGSKNIKIQGSHIDKIKVIERQIKAKNKLVLLLWLLQILLGELLFTPHAALVHN